jgi:hypothetical protein
MTGSRSHRFALFALAPERITERDLREVLVHMPAPRIIALQGSLEAQRCARRAPPGASGHGR